MLQLEANVHLRVPNKNGYCLRFWLFLKLQDRTLLPATTVFTGKLQLQNSEMYTKYKQMLVKTVQFDNVILQII